MTLEKPKSKRSFGYMLRDRVRWVMSIPGLPGHVWQLLVVLSVRADEEGTVYEAITRLSSSTGMPPSKVNLALRDAEQWGLLLRNGTSDYGLPQWQLREGAGVDDPHPLFRTGLLARVRGLLGLSDRQQLLLEAMVDIGYQWQKDTIHVAMPELLSRLSRFDENRISQTINELKRMGLLSVLESGYKTRPGIYRILLPDDDPSESEAELTVEGQECTESSSHTSGYLSMERDSLPANLRTEHDASAESAAREESDSVPPHESSDGAVADSKTVTALVQQTLFWRTLKSIVPDADFNLYHLRALENSSPAPWHVGWAYWVYDTLATFAQMQDVVTPHGLLTSRIANMLEDGRDFAQEPPDYELHRHSDVGAPSQSVHWRVAPQAMAGDEHAARIWAEALEDLRGQIAPVSFATWLADTSGLEMRDGEFMVCTPNAHVAEAIESDLYSYVLAAVTSRCPDVTRVSFAVAGA